MATSDENHGAGYRGIAPHKVSVGTAEVAREHEWGRNLNQKYMPWLEFEPWRISQLAVQHVNLWTTAHLLNR